MCSYLSRIGLSSDGMLPSLESFVNDDDSTTIALEGVMSVLGKIQGTFMAGVRKTISMTTDFFNAIFNRISLYKKRISELKTAVESIMARKVKYASDADNTVKVSGYKYLVYKKFN